MLTATCNAGTVGVRSRLKFFEGNAKLTNIHTFSLPAGWSCPFAKDCLSRANRETGRIQDGPHTVFRCFSASNEMRPSVRNARWHNLRLLKGKSKGKVVRLILTSLPTEAQTVRVHVSGDFFSQAYFDAWLEVALGRPDILFYAYTKSLPYWVRRLNRIPKNFILTASKGGKHDHLIEEYGLRYAQVVFSEADATAMGLQLDHDDSHAMRTGPSFALLIHGSQPAGSEAARAIARLRSQGEYGYGEKADAVRSKRQPLAVV